MLVTASCAAGRAEDGPAWTLPFAVDAANGCTTIATPFSVANPWDAAHEGLDFACEPGTTILAVAEGEVENVEEVQVRGEVRFRVTLLVENGAMRAEYVNLRAVLVVPGDLVAQGDPIGASALGLHLAVWREAEGRYIDPGDFLPLDDPQAVR